MSNIDIGTAMRSLNVGEKIPSYTGVIIHVGQNSSGEDVTYSAGNNSGYVLEVDNPLGTQEMASSILAGLKLRGVSYQPFNAESAILDPSAEIGDNITVNGLNSVIMATTTKHNRLMAADVSAPMEEELDHEFKYEPKSVREFKRESSYTRSRLTIAQDEISAEVTRATRIEGELSSRITLTADAITSEVTRATEREGQLSSSITQTADSLRSAIKSTADGLSSEIDQRLDGITLSVSSSNGSSTFAIKDGSTTLDTETLDLTVKSVNISGTLTIGQLPSDVATEAKVTTITNDTISTSNLLAQNLRVNSANINGLLKASQIEVGSGSNLYPVYDSFEQATPETLTYIKSGNLTATVTTSAYARDGGRVMSCTTNTDVSNSYIHIGHSTTNYGQVRLTAGKYIVSFYALRASGASTLSIRAGVYGRTTRSSVWNDTSLYKSYGSATADIPTGNSWTRVEIPITVESGYPYVCIRLQFMTASSSYYIDCMQIEPVNSLDQKAGAWHPAGTTVINGGNITANSITASAIAAGAITADKISVTDLSALGATIGGWTINSNSISKLSADGNMEFFINAPTSPSSVDYCLYTRVLENGAWSTQFALRYDGSIIAKGALFAWAGSDIGGVGVNSSGILNGISTTNLNDYVNGGVGGGVSYNEAKSGVAAASSFYISTLTCSIINDNNGGQHRLQWKHIQINGTYYYLLGGQW